MNASPSCRLSAGHVCTRSLVTVDVNDSLLDAAWRMTYRRVGALAVLEKGTLVGVISEADVVCAIVEQAALATTPVREYMTEAPITVSASDDVTLAARYMLEHGIGHLPVIDADREVVGMLTRSDLLGVGAVPLGWTA